MRRTRRVARRSTLFGILNGVDYTEWSPDTDPLIEHPYSAEDLKGKARNKAFLLDRLGLAPAPDAPLIGYVELPIFTFTASTGKPNVSANTIAQTVRVPVPRSCVPQYDSTPPSG